MEKAKIVNISNLFTIGDVPSSGYKKYFKIWVRCDMNDADYMESTKYIPENEFRSDILLLCVISYICSDHFNYDSYEDDKNFDWLYSYSGHYLNVYDSESDLYGHTLDGFSLTYFDENGIERAVNIPTLEEIFGDFEIAKREMNKLHDSF